MRLLNRTPIVLRGNLPPLEEREILRAVRIPHLTRIEDVPERGLREAVRKATERASTMASYSAVFRAFQAPRIADDTVFIDGTSEFRSASLARILLGTRFVALIAVTLGETWDAALDELAEQREAAHAWFLDAIGTRLADRAARVAEDRAAADMARQGLARTRRYRPGYGDLALEAQATLCALVDAGRIGVTLNEAFALLPRKSVTGIIGFRAKEEGGAEPEPDEDDP